jgi:hypothetical protein
MIGPEELPQAPVAEEPKVDITMVVPVESGNSDVESVVQAHASVLERAGKSWEAILVFDGVKGSAWEKGLSMQERTKDQVRTIGLHRKFGAAVCLASAFEHARGESLLTLPDYVQVDPASLLGLLEAVEGGADLATGLRGQRVDSAYNRYQSRAFNWLIRALTRTPFQDLNCSVRLMRRTVIEQLSIYGNMYRYLPIIAYRRGFRVDEVPLRHLREEREQGSGFPLAYIRRALDVLGVVFLTGFTHKPLRFFGALGGACMALGASLGTWPFLVRLFGGDVPPMQSPLFLIGLVILVLGLQVIGFGLVGEIVVFTQSRNIREYRIDRIHR